MGEIFSITIPTDEDGLILLKCPLCHNLFKVDGTVFGDDSVFEIHCPSCGIISNNYMTEDVIELGKKMMQNYANDLIEKELKKLERSTNNMIKVKYKSNVKRYNESQIMFSVENLAEIEYFCCKRKAKIKPLLKLCGSYCVYCGEKYYGTE